MSPFSGYFHRPLRGFQPLLHVQLGKAVEGQMATSLQLAALAFEHSLTFERAQDATAAALVHERFLGSVCTLGRYRARASPGDSRPAHRGQASPSLKETRRSGTGADPSRICSPHGSQCFPRRRFNNFAASLIA